MASSEQLELSGFIKRTHENLRNEAKVMGFDAAWVRHCDKKIVLKEYAVAMKELATKYWKNNYDKTAATKSRIHWTRTFCEYYFFKREIVRQRERELEIAKKINIITTTESPYGCNFKENIKLLDVGSCYNPFKEFECFDVLALDIAPANKHVHYCDFLNLRVCDNLTKDFENLEEIVELTKSSFDVVVFSLLLEYFPSPRKRLLCCLKAYDLLKFEGLLIIITPDSKHVGANAKLMKSWRYCLAKLGFSRIKYEKLIHIHCMAFRKSLVKEAAVRWAKLQDSRNFFNELFIPQDFNAEIECDNKSMQIDVKTKLFLLNQLPNL